MEKKERKGFDPAVIKGLTVIIIVTILLIPLGIIGTTIDERRVRSLESETKLLSDYGGEQLFIGPVLIVPYKNRYGGDDRLLFLPREQMVSVDIEPDIRNRGIYEFLLYRSKLEFSGHFDPDFEGIEYKEILWDEAWIEIGLTDMKGINTHPTMNIDGKKITFETGTSRRGWLKSDTPGNIGLNGVEFSGDIEFSGGRSISFVPTGDSNSFFLSSAWDNPSFFGSTLPKSREIIKNEGFSAEYQIVSYIREYENRIPLEGLNISQLESNKFGVKLMFPVERYLLAERSVKYGILFIILPFIVFFIFEIFAGIKVHPFHYLFVGISSSLFFLLLLALSEHFGFIFSYISGSLAVSLLISYYSGYFLKSFKRGITLLPVMGISYLLMYFMINSQDYALLLGSIGLFILVAGVMIATRNVDWYNLGGKR